MQDEDEENWIWVYGKMNTSDLDLYIFSWYFTVTTITTVGYGDISAHTTAERLFCIFLMIIGVLAFSFSTGALSSLLTGYDSITLKMKQRLTLLRSIQQKYELNPVLSRKLKKTLTYDS
jgi:Trk-type K+ transport system membrane component